MIKAKRFRDMRTGEIVERFDVMDIGFMKELDDEPLNAWGQTPENARRHRKFLRDEKKMFRLMRRR